ncbi:MAG TPA: tetratricopeptide repeat protein [Vicinamibacterales bacterium]
MPQQQTSSTTWAIIAGACLVLGLAVGYVIFGGQRPAAPVVTPAAQLPAPASGGPQAGVLDEQQAQALRNVLARDPRNVQANTQLGNLFFDAGRYADAIGPYQQAFALDSGNVNLSTDLGTALWYVGKPDEAIAQFTKSLAINPTHPQTLFNLGIVKKDGKQDPAGAAQAWEKLLAGNPTYVDRAKVQQLLDQVRQQVGTSPIAPVRSTK